jgi:TonB family protein
MGLDMSQWWWRVAVLGLIIGLAVQSAAGESLGPAVKSYNAAVAKNDTASVLSAAKTLAAAIVANPDDPQAKTIALEVGSTLCVLGNCADAAAVAKLAASGSTSGDAAVLLALTTAWAKPEKAELAALGAALKTIQGNEPTVLHVAAHAFHYGQFSKSGDHREAAVAADAAAAHLFATRNLVPEYWARAELVATASAFLDRRKDGSLMRISELYNWLRLQAVPYEKNPDWLNQTMNASLAWEAATSAYLLSSDPNARELRRVKSAEQAHADARTAAGIAHRAANGLPEKPEYCKGELKFGSKPEYPRSASSRNYVGAVVIGFDVTEGKVSNLRVLAAVPNDEFVGAAMAAMETARLDFAATQDSADCLRSYEGSRAPFQYVIR